MGLSIGYGDASVVFFNGPDICNPGTEQTFLFHTRGCLLTITLLSIYIGAG